MVKVSDAIAELQKLPPDTEIFEYEPIDGYLDPACPPPSFKLTSVVKIAIGSEGPGYYWELAAFADEEDIILDRKEVFIW